MLLQKQNAHPRDSKISFEEKNHQYTIEGLTEHPTSVTTLIHRYFPKFEADLIIDRMMASSNWPHSKYFGQTKQEIKQLWENNGAEASQLGTDLHRNIELYLNQESPINPSTPEFQMFLRFWQDFTNKYPTFKPYRTEWLVYDEQAKIAGSIDCVLADEQGNLILLDWKRSKEIKMSNPHEKGSGPFAQYEHCNYMHYALQLNFYRHLLTTCYQKRVIFLMDVIFHHNHANYLCYPIDFIDLTPIWGQL